MKIGDLVLIPVKQSYKTGMIVEMDIRDYSDDIEPWTSYKVLVGEEIIVTHTGKIKLLDIGDIR